MRHFKKPAAFIVNQYLLHNCCARFCVISTNASDREKRIGEILSSSTITYTFSSNPFQLCYIGQTDNTREISITKRELSIR